MFTPIHFEVFSTGMKARLNPTYRRELELSQRQDEVEPWEDCRVNRTTALPFTTRTKAYGTYGRRKR